MLWSRDDIRAWDGEWGNGILYPSKDYGEAITSFATSADGRYLVSGYFDGLIRVWDARYICSGPSGEHDHIVRDRSEHPISRDDDDAVPGSSLSCFGDESIMDGGWILHSPDALMFWVPPWCRTGLICGKTNETGFDSFFTWGILASVPGITYLRRAPCTIFQFYFP